MNKQIDLHSTLFLLISLRLILTGNETWHSTNLIWNLGIATSCNIGPSENPEDYFKNEPVFQPSKYSNIKSGDILWIQPHFATEFYQYVFPFIRVPFVLVVNDGDESFPSDCLPIDHVEALLENKYLIHLFAQNCDYQGSSKKISPIPIGIDFHTVSYKSKTGGWGMAGSPKQQEAALMNALQTSLPTSQRKLKAFIDFQHSDTMHGSFQRYLQFGEDRTSIFKTLLETDVVDHAKWMNRKKLWDTKKEYAFSISPHGNGLDCHRTWEDLALGCIVIIKSSPLNRLYQGLPIVLIENWDEINKENFQKWIKEYGDVSHNPSYREKLTHYYWIRKIKNAAEPYILHP